MFKLGYLKCLYIRLCLQNMMFDFSLLNMTILYMIVIVPTFAIWFYYEVRSDRAQKSWLESNKRLISLLEETTKSSIKHRQRRLCIDNLIKNNPYFAVL